MTAREQAIDALQRRDEALAKVDSLTAQLQEAQQNLSAILTRDAKWLRARADSIEREGAE